MYRHRPIPFEGDPVPTCRPSGSDPKSGRTSYDNVSVQSPADALLSPGGAKVGREDRHFGGEHAGPSENLRRVLCAEAVFQYISA